MAESLVRKLLDSGIHFGHKAQFWHPKMKPFIYGKSNGIHIIDVRHTVRGLMLAKRFLTRTVASGKDVLFVGTKRQAIGVIEQHCKELGMPYVTERWLGGTLTNFRTIRSRLKRLEELEALMAGEDWSSYSKKMASQLTRERRKIHRNLSGIRTMTSLPGALVVIDVHREINALREAKALGIPTICLIDTDSDPDLADIPIPGNDDALRAVETVVSELAAAISEGKGARAQQQMAGKGEAAAGAPQRRRSSRAMFRAEAATDEGAATDTAVAQAEPAEESSEPQIETTSAEEPASEKTD